MTEVFQQKRLSRKSKNIPSDVFQSQLQLKTTEGGAFEKWLLQVNEWLETHWSTPAYGSYVLGVIGLCLFAAATNTMAGWLYVISGLIGAMLLLGAILPSRALRGIKISRNQLNPVSVDEELNLEIEIYNATKKTISLLEVSDLLPYVLSDPYKAPIEIIPPESVHRLSYYPKAAKRGIYHWENVKLKTATPLGLFWCSRIKQAPAKAVVYPRVLSLTQCPLIDSLGRDDSKKMQSDRIYQKASEGLTRALRPYREGDPTRLIHWRTSARFDEFKVRELEIVTGSEEVVICLDNAFAWQADIFEEAVVAAASLFFYASRCQLQAYIWSASTGLVHGNRQVLEALAGVECGEEVKDAAPPKLPLIWLTENALTLPSLPVGSRWVLFSSTSGGNFKGVEGKGAGVVINQEQSLQSQLQKPF